MIGFARSAVQKKICSKKQIEVGTDYKLFVKKAAPHRGDREVMGARDAGLNSVANLQREFERDQFFYFVYE
jgi:hypothetical protein